MEVVCTGNQNVLYCDPKQIGRYAYKQRAQEQLFVRARITLSVVIDHNNGNISRTYTTNPSPRFVVIFLYEDNIVCFKFADRKNADVQYARIDAFALPKQEGMATKVIKPQNPLDLLTGFISNISNHSDNDFLGTGFLAGNDRGGNFLFNPKVLLGKKILNRIQRQGALFYELGKAQSLDPSEEKGDAGIFFLEQALSAVENAFEQKKISLIAYATVAKLWEMVSGDMSDTSLHLVPNLNDVERNLLLANSIYLLFFPRKAFKDTLASNVAIRSQLPHLFKEYKQLGLDISFKEFVEQEPRVNMEVYQLVIKHMQIDGNEAQEVLRRISSNRKKAEDDTRNFFQSQGFNFPQEGFATAPPSDFIPKMYASPFGFSQTPGFSMPQTRSTPSETQSNTGNTERFTSFHDFMNWMQGNS